MSLTVAIVGRPNVGKSTLFNRLAGKKLALVDDTPGVTRDWRLAPAVLAGMDLTVIDTAGLEDTIDDSLEGRMRRQTEQAIRRADVVLMVVDARGGITPLDRQFAVWLRKQGLPVILVANKCEGKGTETGLAEAWELGLGEPLPLSAEHGQGLSDLVTALAPHWKKKEEASEEITGSEDEKGPIQLAIVGRPNVGKSTLLNSLLGEDRALTGPEAGLTRDPVTADFIWKERSLRLVDTAGLRRKARIDDRLEKMATAETLRIIRLAQVVVLVLDGNAILDNQDLTIARMVIDEGRALVIAVNKWDAIEDKTAALKRLKDRLESALAQARGVPALTISALKNRKLDNLLDAVLEVYDLWNTRIPTARLNQWLRGAVDSHPPPVVEGRRIRLRYATQIKSRPPTLA
ncbi:MAG: ribosome biogenesis GTPase Der, partial [Pseudomonadota bacterium]|nr:ribosome biogenesis GTPase Der [Pseudomonadota bacterium]